jgi:competence ComEA-like helix-hairpin-helix protein
MPKIKHNHNCLSLKLVILLFVLCYFACTQKFPESSYPSNDRPAAAVNAININTAAVEELAKLPQIGERFAKKIVEYRETYGPFRRPEHLMLVEGINDKKFRVIRDFIRTE